MEDILSTRETNTLTTFRDSNSLKIKKINEFIFLSQNGTIIEGKIKKCKENLEKQKQKYINLMGEVRKCKKEPHNPQKNYGISLLYLTNNLSFENIYQQNSPQLQRFKRQSEECGFKNLINASIIIQKFIRMKICRKRFIKFIEEKYLKSALPAAIKIQREYRKFIKKLNEKFAMLIQIILIKRVEACRKIQMFYRKRVNQIKLRFGFLVKLIIERRKKAVNIIIKNYNKFLKIRIAFLNILKFERNLFSLRYPQEANNVYAELTNKRNQTRGRFKLEKCPLRGIFIAYFNSLIPGEYFLKFEVDGKFTEESKLVIRNGD